jgi:hypothetical protein
MRSSSIVTTYQNKFPTGWLFMSELTPRSWFEIYGDPQVDKPSDYSLARGLSIYSGHGDSVIMGTPGWGPLFGMLEEPLVALLGVAGTGPLTGKVYNFTTSERTGIPYYEFKRPRVKTYTAIANVLTRMRVWARRAVNRLQRRLYAPGGLGYARAMRSFMTTANEYNVLGKRKRGQ